MKRIRLNHLISAVVTNMLMMVSMINVSLATTYDLVINNGRH